MYEYSFSCMESLEEVYLPDSISVIPQNAFYICDKLKEVTVPDSVKTRRLQEIIALQNELSEQSNRNDVGRCFEVLIESPSRKDPSYLMGRTMGNKAVVFPGEGHRVGEFVYVKITTCTSATLLGHIVDEQTATPLLKKQCSGE